jgi:hypothetical protein
MMMQMTATTTIDSGVNHKNLKDQKTFYPTNN